MDKTTEFSFVLKPAEHGVGVFTTHDIKSGASLRLFGDDKNPEESRMLDKQDVPKEFHQYCLDRGSKLACPEDFGSMPVGWYLNHSRSPNAKHRNFEFFATRDIVAGEEITIDYNLLGEPEDTNEDYFRT